MLIEEIKKVLRHFWGMGSGRKEICLREIVKYV